MSEEVEIWKDVPGYEGSYQVSDQGRVKSLDRWIRGRIYKGKPRKLYLDRFGYYNVGLRKNRKLKLMRVHKVVAMAFLGHVPCGYKEVINHKNINPKDNRPENLERVTPRENSNRKHLPSSSKYIGVCWDKGRKKWRADIRVGRKITGLGRYVDEYDAHLAYEKALDNVLSGRPPK